MEEREENRVLADKCVCTFFVAKCFRHTNIGKIFFFFPLEMANTQLEERRSKKREN